MKYALVNDDNIVQNVIEYDGVAPYVPPTGLHLVQVNDWVQIGDDKDKPEPVPEPAPEPQP